MPAETSSYLPRFICPASAGPFLAAGGLVIRQPRTPRGGSETARLPGLMSGSCRSDITCRVDECRLPTPGEGLEELRFNALVVTPGRKLKEEI